MEVKKIIKKLILVSLIFSIVFSFLGVHKVYAQEKLSKETIIKSNEQPGHKFRKFNKVRFYKPQISRVGARTVISYYLLGEKTILNKIDFPKPSGFRGWSLNKAGIHKNYHTNTEFFFNNKVDYKLDGSENIDFGDEVKELYACFDYFDFDNPVPKSFPNIDSEYFEDKPKEMKNVSITSKSEILSDGRLKLSHFNSLTNPLDIHGDIYALIDTKALNMEFDNFKYTVKYYSDNKLISENNINDYFDEKNEFNLPRFKEFYLTNYLTSFPDDKDDLEKLLRKDLNRSNKTIDKYLYRVIRIPRKILDNSHNEGTYMTISHFNGLPDAWQDRIDLFKNIRTLGLKDTSSTRKYTYMLDTEMAEKLLNKRKVHNEFVYDKYLDMLNSYHNINFSKEKFEEHVFGKIAFYDQNNTYIHNSHIFSFNLFYNENISNFLYSAKSGKHTITKIDDLLIKDRNITDFKKMLHVHLSNQIEGNKLTDILDEEYEVKSTDDLFSLDDAEIEKLKKEHQDFFKDSGSYSKTYKMRLTINKDFLHRNYVPYDKSTWEPDMDLYLNVVFSKPVVNIEFKNYSKDSDIYTFYTTNLDNYSFLENIKITERKHNEEINISYKAVVNGDTLNLYRLDNHNFKLNSNPIKFKILKFPAELIGNKSWYLIKTHTVSNEDVIKHYKIQSLDEDKYVIKALKNPMLEKGENVKNGYLEINVVSTTNISKGYTYLIPVYRDSELETKFKNDTDEAKYFNSSNPQLVNQVIHPLKHKLNVDRIRDRFLFASLFDKEVNIESVNKNNYYKSVDLVYKQVYLAKDDDVALENQATHTITYVANRAFDSKFFISSAGTGNYIFHKSNKEKMTKEKLLNNFASFYQGKIDSIRLSKVDIKGKNISIDEQNKALDRFTKEPNTTLKERIFIEGIKNGERVFVNQFILENVDDNYFLSKSGNTTNSGTKDEPSIVDEAKSFLTDYKIYIIIAVSGILGLVFLLIVLKIVFPSKKERVKKIMRILKKNAYSKELNEKLSEFFISRKYKKNKILEVIKTINSFLDKKIPEDEIIEIIKNAIRNDYDNLDFTIL